MSQLRLAGVKRSFPRFSIPGMNEIRIFGAVFGLKDKSSGYTLDPLSIKIEDELLSEERVESEGRWSEQEISLSLCPPNEFYPVAKKARRMQEIEEARQAMPAAQSPEMPENSLTCVEQQPKKAQRVEEIEQGEPINDEKPTMSAAQSLKNSPKLARRSPAMPENILKCINQHKGTDIRWVGKKDIYTADITNPEGELLLPRQVEGHLTEAEKDLLRRNVDKTMKVGVVASVKGNVLMLKYQPSNNRFLLTKKWMDFVRQNYIEAGKHQLHIWSFRMVYSWSPEEPPHFCLAINVHQKEDQRPVVFLD